MPTSARTRVVALISGRGTNLQALLDAAAADFPAEIVGIISNREDAAGLERGRAAGVAVDVVSHRDFESREAFDQALLERIEAFRPDLIVLAGFMRILTDEFVQYFEGRMLNIHPSLLPAFPGLDTHRRALDAGVPEHGATVHFVTPTLDAGPIIIQARVLVEPDDDEHILAARVLREEHRIYPLAVHWFAKGRLRLRGGTVLLDGEPLGSA